MPRSRRVPNGAISSLVSLLSLVSLGAYAAGPGDASAEVNDINGTAALEKTQGLLRDPAAREKAAQSDPSAAAAAKQLKDVAGSAQTEGELYGLAADILGDLAKDAKGDPLKMMELIAKAQSDPNGFGAKLSPAQREKIRALSKRVPAASRGAGSDVSGVAGP